MMQTEIQSTIEQYEDDEIVLDLGGIFDDYVRCLKRCWLQLLLVLLTVTSLVTAYLNHTYVPAYTAKITYAVDKTGDTATDAAIAKRLSQSASTLASFREFRQELTANILEDSRNENYRIAASNTEGSNLFSVQISANNYKNANLLLDNLKEIYPRWASETVGAVELQIVDESKAGKTPANPYRLPMSAAKGALAGAVLCFAVATVYVAMTGTVRRESDMQKVTGKACIAAIPNIQLKKRVNSKKEQLMLTNKRVDWGFKQTLLTAQTRIERLMEKEGKQVVLVASTIPEEGKSVVAANLAIAFAQREKRVLIIDGDFRNPTVGRLLGIEGGGAGLSDYFRKISSLDEIIQTKDDVDFIGGGTSQGKASTTLEDRKMQELMEELRNLYDYIVIDTPPSHLFADGAVLAEYADAVMYVVRYDRAAVKEIRDAIAPYIREEKLLGYVINRHPGGYSSYGYGGRYGKYGKYGKYGGYGRYGKYRSYPELDKKAMNTEDSL